MVVRSKSAHALWYINMFKHEETWWSWMAQTLEQGCVDCYLCYLIGVLSSCYIVMVVLLFFLETLTTFFHSLCSVGTIFSTLRKCHIHFSLFQTIQIIEVNLDNYSPLILEVSFLSYAYRFIVFSFLWCWYPSK